MNDWSQRDRNLAIALMQFEASTCGGCGQPLHESTDPDGPDYSVEDRQCRGCLTLDGSASENDEPGTQHYLEVTRHRH